MGNRNQAGFPLTLNGVCAALRHKQKCNGNSKTAVNEDRDRLQNWMTWFSAAIFSDGHTVSNE